MGTLLASGFSRRRAGMRARVGYAGRPTVDPIDETRVFATRAAALAVVLTLAMGACTAVAATGAGSAAVPKVDKVVVVVFENKEFREVIGSGEAPTFDLLAKRYALLTRYHGVTHPSLPNYLALVSGSTHGVTSDCASCRVAGPNLADTLERAGKTWKTYAEGLPAPGFTGRSAGRYAKKHNPLLYFADVHGRPDRLRRIVPLRAFARDLRAHALPDFSLVVPDQCHDMHDCPVSTGDAWLRTFLRPLLRSAELAHGVVYVVFDEGRDEAGGDARVPALVVGPLVRPGSRARGRLDHYSLLRTIEDAWQLPRLARSRAARPITGIWR